ncbi:MAG TPA: thioredoxin domain-containing protein, partial [Chthoniobacteraceae bacterium]|nr:thioredoxin domain-containing protein [Chthoniobacteraceae bacterium]
MKATSTPNRLAKEKSPYLLQHQNNPVDWYPWGPEAFDKARKENKPIFLSIGYSTCHWCHVMAHESFENEEAAKILNDNFVSIKLDREERPDVDRVYMTFVQATTGGGGWPMSVFLTPELKPFLGGTYFPLEDKYGRPGFKTVLGRVSDGWKNDREGIIEHGTKVVEQLREYSAAARPGETKTSEAMLINALNPFSRTYDNEWGGFGDAPKFPRPAALNFLFRMYGRLESREGEREQRDAKSALGMAIGTLRKMAEGGMHDHLGGGFHRYSVDKFWHVPHYEKMLYDQAQLANSYLDGVLITKDARFEKTVRDILDYVRRDLTSPEGGFFSAEDADSLLGHGKPEHAEGAFYVWTKAEIESVLGEEAAGIFNRVYGVEADGNSPAGSDPHGELKGKNTLIERMSGTDAAKLFKKTEPEIELLLASARQKLFEVRAKRPRPHLDDKIITAWNGLMISAFARAAQVLDDANYLRSAQKAAKFLRDQMWKEGALRRSYRQGPSEIPGFAEDYAYLIAGLLDLYEADFDPAHLQWAVELQATMDNVFYDNANGGYFSTSGKDPNVLLRMKEDYDGAEPSPSSIAALNLVKLAQITGDSALRERADKTLAAYAEGLAQMPNAMPQMLCALDAGLNKSRQ